MGVSRLFRIAARRSLGAVGNKLWRYEQLVCSRDTGCLLGFTAKLCGPSITKYDDTGYTPHTDQQ